MNTWGEWIANCKPDRVDRIRSAGVFRLQVGPPRPNQFQTMDGLLADGIVGLYRVEKKAEPEALADQARYLAESDFSPSPQALRDLLGSLAPDRAR